MFISLHSTERWTIIVPSLHFIHSDVELQITLDGETYITSGVDVEVADCKVYTSTCTLCHTIFMHNHALI